MGNINKEFCSYSISLKLKELGFDESCLMCFTSMLKDNKFNTLWFSDTIWGDSDYHRDPRECKNSDFTNEKSCTAPLWQQAIDWFDKEKSLAIMHYYNTNCNKWQFIIINKRDNSMSDNYYSNEQVILKAVELCQKKKINLEEILDKIHDKNYRSSYKTWYSKQCIIDAMKEACKQTLELAAENAKTREMTESWSGQVWDDGPLPICVDKDSILNTINQIK